MARDQFNQKSLGIPLNTMVKETDKSEQARILMVGAGGIGCELLKNLVLVGFGEIHIVDLDTIDLSNLNRQFLFRHEHIKKSKALVAKEAAHKFNPNVKLEAHHANIKDRQFNVEWFKGFTMVFNALDNLDARRHVNKMCLAAEVPLIESGTTGFNGQVQVIKKGQTACYDCTTKETPKSFPVCTIRSTPSQPIHCIVWGKSYLLSEIFGASEDESPEMDHSKDTENGMYSSKEIEKLRQEAQALKQIKEAIGSDTFPQLLFNKVYKDDITRLRSMEEMWKTRRPPGPLDYETIIKEVPEIGMSKERILKDGQRIWNLQENTIVFKDSLERLSARLQTMKSSSNGSSAEPIITFDKDDDDTLDFVTASANLRSIIFGIETKSRFDIKQMAGNIIPAIATTNAIVADLFLTYIQVFLSPFAPERLLASDRIRAPNPDCEVCSVAQTRLLVDMSRATLNDLVEDFLRMELGYGDELSVKNEVGLLYDPEETENLSKKLSELGIKSDSFLTVTDEDEDNPRVNLVLNVRESSTELDDKPIKGLDISASSEAELPTSPIPRRKKPAPPVQPALTNGHANGKKEGSDPISSAAKKRTASEALDGDSPDATRKKHQPNGQGTTENDDLIIIEDDGAILIDD
ncbi:Pmt3-activating enzyme subunit 2 [Hyphodiscus hymeniophilus]|uniref:Ubiquitin-activating enzyme E1-like n=1 Tax=Hyphodiscus hymeniophilus TaxID=353542 RepID=A0A9P7AZQ3_9HELO|nr:Pmt3-activating enzyme subunit 2 [Hyphodiscus hymeniophilus]